MSILKNIQKIENEAQAIREQATKEAEVLVSKTRDLASEAAKQLLKNEEAKRSAASKVLEAELSTLEKENSKKISDELSKLEKLAKANKDHAVDYVLSEVGIK